MALKQSPIDNAGLSGVCEARLPGLVGEIVSNSIVLHQAAFRASVVVEVEGSREGVPPDDRQSAHSLEASMGTGEVKDAGDLV